MQTRQDKRESQEEKDKDSQQQVTMYESCLSELTNKDDYRGGAVKID